MAELGVSPDLIERILNHSPKGVAGTYNRHRYFPEMREALLTYEAFILTLVKPGPNRAMHGSPLETKHETAEQARATPEDHGINPTSHAPGKAGEVPATNPAHTEPRGLAGE
jgi:hypothetical protein